MTTIRFTALALLLGLGAATSAQAQVWKCNIDGKTHYSDQPCPAKGEQLKSQALQGNVIDTSADRAAAAAATERARAAAATEAQMQAAPGAPAPAATSVCPSDRDIANMETKASSTTMKDDAKRFVQDEIRRARQCRKGQGNYTAADWNISKQAVDAQDNLTGAADARRRAESMHSAANAVEGDRISRDRGYDEREARRRAQQGLRERDRDRER